MSTMIIFEKSYDGESIVDLGRDVVESLDQDFNPAAAAIPVDQHGFQQGRFRIVVEWQSE